MNSDVFVVRTESHYPVFPYDSDNRLLSAIKLLFVMWGKDPGNPFKEWVGPGARVVLKPNWVYHESPKEKTLDALITNSGLIQHLIDLLAVALHGHGSILIGDAPIQSCNFQSLVKRAGVAEVVQRAQKKYPGLDIKIEDWRLTILESSAALQRHRTNYEEAVADDYEIVDLGAASFLEDISDYADKFRVTCYDHRLMSSHHRKGKHEYLLTQKVFDADLVINLPKMKTHIKAGLTGALKNIVGINGHKEFLPHHILGASEKGGDCYYKSNRIRDLYDRSYDKFWARYETLSESKRKTGIVMLAGLWRVSKMLTGDSVSTGSWQGNETIWRMTLDLNHLLYFGKRTSKKIVSIVDGIIAGEGEGPLTPTPKAAGLLVAGENPAYVDAALAKLMGYNISRVPTVYHSIYHRKSKFAGPYLENFNIQLSEDNRIRSVPFHHLPNLDFIKPQHWTRAAEIDSEAGISDETAHPIELDA